MYERPAPGHSAALPALSSSCGKGTECVADQRHQALARAALALKPRHSGLEYPAQQKLPELALGLQVLGDDLMEHGVLGVSPAIHVRDTSHASG
jgi:hypothetical protein